MLKFSNTLYILRDKFSLILNKVLFILGGSIIIILYNILILFEYNLIRNLLSNIWQIRFIILFYMFLNVAFNDPVSVLLTVFILLPSIGNLPYLFQHPYYIDLVKSISTFSFQSYSDSRVHLNSVPIIDSIKKGLDVNNIGRVLAIISLIVYYNISPFKTILLLCESSQVFEYIVIMFSLLVIPSIIIYCFIFRIFTIDNLIRYLCPRVVVMVLLSFVFPMSWLLIKSYLFVELFAGFLHHLFLDGYLYINGIEDFGTGSKTTNTGDDGSNGNKGNYPGNKGNYPGNKGNNLGKNVTPNDKPAFKLEFVFVTKQSTSMVFLFNPDDPSGETLKGMKKDPSDNKLHDIAVKGQIYKAVSYAWQPENFVYKSNTGEYVNEFGISKKWGERILGNYDVKQPTSFVRGPQTGLISRVIAKETVENAACMDPESIKPYRNYYVNPEEDAFYQREHVEAQNTLGKKRTFDEHLSAYNKADKDWRGKYTRAQKRYKQARLNGGEPD